MRWLIASLLEARIRRWCCGRCSSATGLVRRAAAGPKNQRKTIEHSTCCFVSKGRAGALRCPGELTLAWAGRRPTPLSSNLATELRDEWMNGREKGTGERSEDNARRSWPAENQIFPAEPFAGRRGASHI